MNRDEFLVEMVSHIWFEVTFTRNLLVDLVEKNKDKIVMWDQEDVLRAHQNAENALMEALEKVKERNKDKEKEKVISDDKVVSIIT